jgi:hypothetical protein
MFVLRYTVCVHADRKLIERETWIEELVAINACSDGIIVDLTPPTKGRLWIGTNPGISYQVIFQCLYLNLISSMKVEVYTTSEFLCILHTWVN